jgi:hypothetical protein
MAQEIKGAALPALCVQLNGGRIDRQNPQAQGYARSAAVNHVVVSAASSSLCLVSFIHSNPG